MKNRLPYYENSFLFFLSLDSTQKFDENKTSISCQIRSTCVQFSRTGIILQSAPKLKEKNSGSNSDTHKIQNDNKKNKKGIWKPS